MRRGPDGMPASIRGPSAGYDALIAGEGVLDGCQGRVREPARVRPRDRDRWHPAVLGNYRHAGNLDSDYSRREYAVSVLGSEGAPFELIQRANFVVLGISILALAAATRRAFHGALVGPAFLVVHAVGRIGEGAFAWDPSEPASAVSLLHNVFGFAAVISMLAVPAVLYRRISSHSRGLEIYTLVTAVIFVCLFVALVLLAPAFGLSPLGLSQRIGFGVWYLWAVALAGWMFAREASPTPA